MVVLRCAGDRSGRSRMELPPDEASSPSLSIMAAISAPGKALWQSGNGGFFLTKEAVVTIHDKVATPERKYRNFAVEKEIDAVRKELNSELEVLYEESADAPKNQTALASFLAAAKFAKRFFFITPFHDGNIDTLQAVVATLMPAGIRLDIDEHNKAAFVQLLQVAQDREVADFLASTAAPSPVQPSNAVARPELPQFAVKTKVAAAARIKEGFQHFKDETYTKNPDWFKKLSDGQSPEFMVIACSDSRVCPTTILGFQPGEAFVVRNIANMVPPPEKVGYPGTSAALEYAVKHLKVKNILVIGHSRCGGIKALMTLKDDAPEESTFIEDWIEIGKPARASTLDATEEIETRCTKCEKESVNVSLTNLLKFQFVEDGVKSGQIALHGGYYNFVDGSFEYWTCGGDGKPSEITEF